MKIDINSDLGEGFGPYKMGPDEELLPLVSSANIACGFHAGDPSIMASTIDQAVRHGVDVGAHPGFNDRFNFGRKRLPYDLKVLRAEVLYQLGALQALAASAGTRVTHMSFHGALGNMMYEDRELAETLVKAVAEVAPDIILPVVPNIETERAAHKFGLRTVRKFFADRAYNDKGLLVSRGTPNSVIHDTAIAARRVLQLLDSGTVTTIDGNTIRMDAQVVIVHSDTAGSVELAKAIRETVTSAGGEIVPMSKLVG